MKYLLEARKIELRQLGIDPDTLDASNNGTQSLRRRRSSQTLTLDTCPDYLDARDCLAELSAAPLTLETQTTCRRLRVLVDRLAVDVARAGIQ